MQPSAPLILIIEDHDDTRELYAASLGFDGFRVRTAAGAAEALSAAHDEPPAVIVTDLKLPGVDGFTAIEWIKADPTLCDRPIVMLTGSVFPEEQRRAAALGVRAFLRKPCLPSELASTLRSILALNG